MRERVAETDDQARGCGDVPPEIEQIILNNANR
jgi:hypothetical protein